MTATIDIPTAPDHDAEIAARLSRLAAHRRDQPTQSPASTHPTGTMPTSSTDRGAARPARPRHPAHGSRVGALVLSLASIVALTWGFASGAIGAPAPIGARAPALAPVSAAPGVSPAAAGVTSTVAGSVAENQYGPVQVQATFASDGRLVTVQALQVPTGGKSTRINDQAAPVLNREALAAQSANVHTVSGATYTSDGYATSL